MYFNKPLAANNFLNDNDENVYNLFEVVKTKKDELVNCFIDLPLHESIFNQWKISEEIDPIWKAVRFIMLSNASYMGKSDTFHHRTNNNPKKSFESKIQATFEMIKNARFMCCDFREVLGKIAFESGKDKLRDMEQTFIYADPPYLGQTHNYKTGFKKNDTIDLFELLSGCGMKFAISEFKNKLIVDLADQLGLQVIPLNGRQSLKNRRTEILITNYRNTQMSLFELDELGISQ